MLGRPKLNRATRLKLKRGSRPKLNRSTRPILGARSDGHTHTQSVDEDDGITRYNCCVDYKPNHYAPVEFTKVKFPDLYTEVADYFQALESKQTEWQN